MSVVGKRIGTYSGNWIDIEDPQPEDITLDDLFRGMSKAIRFGGQIDADYTVGQHSIYAMYFVETDDPQERLQALMHDASEGLLGDMPTPLKGLCTEYKAIEEKFMHVIADKFGFPWPMSDAVHRVDRRLVLNEKRAFQPTGPTWSPAYGSVEEFGHLPLEDWLVLPTEHVRRWLHSIYEAKLWQQPNLTYPWQ